MWFSNACGAIAKFLGHGGVRKVLLVILGLFAHVYCMRYNAPSYVHTAINISLGGGLISNVGEWLARAKGASAAATLQPILASVSTEDFKREMAGTAADTREVAGEAEG